MIFVYNLQKRLKSYKYLKPIYTYTQNDTKANQMLTKQNVEEEEEDEEEEEKWL